MQLSPSVEIANAVVLLCSGFLVNCGMLECSKCFFLQFNKQIKKAEGYKPQKVELVISIDTISVVEPKLKVVDLQSLEFLI